MFNLKYYTEVTNIGDVFSRLVAESFLSPDIYSCDKQPQDSPNILLLGSILEWSDKHSFVCGTGLIFSHSILESPPLNIECVRGPLTGYFLNKQGVKCPAVYADPGVLAPELFPPVTNQKYGVHIGIIPHYIDKGSSWLDKCQKEGCLIIDVLAPPEEFFQQLQRCDIILASSLHGIIFAHSYGIPCVWIELSNNVFGNGFKFYDYYLSVGVSPGDVPHVVVSENTTCPKDIAKHAKLSSQTDLIAPFKEALLVTKKKLLAAMSNV